MTRKTLSSLSGESAALVFGFALIAVLFGAWGALGGWFGQLVALLILVPVMALAIDYRLGLILSILVLPYTNAPFLKGLGLFTVTNILLLGTFCAILVRWARYRLDSKRLNVPLPRQLVIFYLAPILIGMLIGSTHLREIPQQFLSVNQIASFGLQEYWVSYWLKGMLLVVFALALGVAVAEHGAGTRFIAVFVASAVIFSLAIMAIIAVSGASIPQLKESRGFLHVLGRHNTEAGFMLSTAIATTLFMREHVKEFRTRALLLAALAIMTAAMLLTFTRGALLCLVVVMIYYVWYFRRPWPLITAILLSLAAVVLMPDAIRERMLLGFDIGNARDALAASGPGDKLTMGRTWVWTNLAPEILKAPLFGSGLLSTEWSTLVKEGLFFAHHPHSLYLSILMDLGFVGLVLMVFFYLYMWRTFSALARQSSLEPIERGFFAGGLALLVTCLVWGITNGAYFPVPEQIFLWTIFGISLGYRSRLQRKV